MTYIQPKVTLVGTTLEHIAFVDGLKGPGSCRDAESTNMSTQGAYDLDE